MKKLGTLCLVLVVALGLLGLGFAHWQQELFINGTVNTGKLCVGIRDVGTNDPPAAAGEVSLDPGYDKDVASMKSINGEEKCLHNQIQYYHDIEYVISNAYPSYSATGFYDIANCGTIPVKIEKIQVSRDSGANWEDISPCVPTLVDLDNDGTADLTLHVTNIALKQQIDPCNVAKGDLTVHVEQDTKEESLYKFHLRIKLTQWNCVK